MDASALLTRQGWRGQGHALDRAGRGVKKPLLVSQKSNTFGLGKKKVDVQADQWWARAFDAGLKSLDVGSPGNATSTAGKDSQAKSSAGQNVVKKNTKISELSLLANGGRKWMGLYDGFVKGEGLESTIGRNAVSRTTVQKGEVVSKNGEAERSEGLQEEKLKSKKKEKKKRRRRDEDGDTAVDHTSKDTSGALLVTPLVGASGIHDISIAIEDGSDQPAKRKKKKKHRDQDKLKS